MPYSNNDDDKPNKKYIEEDLSLYGGLCYLDLNGKCIPDIVVSHEENKTRIIEIYTSHNEGKETKFKYKLNSEIVLGDKPYDYYGAFVLARINDKNYRDNSPLLDILIPNIKENKILHFKNQNKDDYTWSKEYCSEGKKEEEGKLFLNNPKKEGGESLKIDGVEEIEIDNSFPTVFRMGDFLGSSNPEILVKKIINK